MNKRIVIALCGVLLGFCALRAERIMVIADPHVLAPSLMTQGAALDSMMVGQRKMIDLSASVFSALVDTALTHRPDLILIPGDLTKDGEKVSHEWMAAQLAQLREAGIPTLVIPGNHDIRSTASYAYDGDNKTKVENVTDAEFDAIYASYMGAMKDAGSHSYVAEPIAGVTVLAMDGSNGNAGEGSLSNNTLNWLLNQADAATAKGNMVIAMCHWQLIDHFDQQSVYVAACQLKNAKTVAQQLAQHKVHLVLTGHMHVNDICTAFYNPTSGTQPDSIVEIGSGSPITYPCPYRWLDIAQDRISASVQTDFISSLDTIPDLYAYSRAWQEEHTENMVPNMSKKLWSKVDAMIPSSLVNMLSGLPKTDEERAEMFQRHMGSDVVAMYMLHSDGNEPTRPEKDSIVDAFTLHMSDMMDEVLDNSDLNVLTRAAAEGVMKPLAFSMTEAPVTSMTEDKTTSDNPKYENRTDDLELTLELNAPASEQGLENTAHEVLSGSYYDLLGRPVNQPVSGQIVIMNNHKQVTK